MSQEENQIRAGKAVFAYLSKARHKVRFCNKVSESMSAVVGGGQKKQK